MSVRNPTRPDAPGLSGLLQGKTVTQNQQPGLPLACALRSRDAASQRVPCSARVWSTTEEQESHLFTLASPRAQHRGT